MTLMIETIDVFLNMLFYRRRAKPLSNGTTSEGDSSPKKAGALLKAIQKGNLGKKVYF